jgi:glycosyltransferase involved in cell wall biosynthesis
MFILYIHQYFATPKGKTGTRSYEFAKRWVKAGHNVRMLTAVAQLCEQDLQDAKGRFIKRITIDGIDVRAVNLPYNQKMGFIKRCLSFIGFVLIASVYVLFVKRSDVIYATSTPLTVGIPALIAKWFRRIPFVFEVRDQWPEIPIELGIIKNKFLIKALLWLEKTIYKEAGAIVAGSPGQAEGIKSVCQKSKTLEVVPNSCDIELFRPDIDGSHIRNKYKWGDKLVFLHAGAMGKVNSLNFVIEVAAKLKDNPEILFVLIGEGGQKPILQSRVKELGLTNVEILHSVPKQELPKYFAAVDIGLVIISNFSILEHNSANKFFDSLSAGKPVLLNYSGWKREILEENNAGFGCELCNLDEFVEKTLYFNSHRQELLEMGQNARRAAEEKFDRDKLATQALTAIKSVEL